FDIWRRHFMLPCNRRIDLLETAQYVVSIDKLLRLIQVLLRRMQIEWRTERRDSAQALLITGRGIVNGQVPTHRKPEHEDVAEAPQHGSATHRAQVGHLRRVIEATS